MSDVDRFLARVVPWPTTDRPGYVNIHWSPSYAGRAFQEDRTAIGFTNGMMRNPVDLYVCMSLQARSHEPEIKNGKQRRRAIRHGDNAVALRSFWLDIDIKDGKFTDTTDAARQFGECQRKIGLPLPSIMLLTGSGGFHAHWTLEQPITPDVWLPLAHALVAAFQQHGFRADYGRSINPAQVLRIPGTFNQKHKPPVLSRIIHDGPDLPLTLIEQVLTPYKGGYAPGVTQQPAISGKLGKPSAVFAGVTLPPRLDAGLDTYVPTIEEVAAECPFIDATLRTGGATHSEPLWRESLRVASFVQDGEEVAHELSDQHPGYTEKETDEKYAHVLQNQRQYGWPQCQKIHDEGGVECKQCPHLKQGRSPLNFAKPLVRAAVAVATAAAIAAAPVVQTPQQLPATYGQHRNGIIYKLVKDPEHPELGDIPREVYPRPISNLRAFEKTADGGDYAVAFDCAVAPDKVRSVQLAYEEFTDLRTLISRMSKQGLSIEHEHAKLMKGLMVSFTQQLSLAKERVYDCKPYGWSKNHATGALDGFCFGGKRWNGSTTVAVQPLDREIDEEYTVRGDFQVWKDACRLITDQQQMELTAAVCASYGAPLTLFTGHNGLVYHLWSPDSGTGKSSALHVGQAVWATTSKMSQIADTPNAVNLRLGMSRNLPVCYDELKKTNDKKFIEFIHQVQLGKTKSRLNRASQAMPTYTWHTMLIAGSNSSLHGYITDNDPETTAAINRVFECRVHPNAKGLGLIERTKAQRMLAALQDNHGHAGLEYAKFLGANIDTVKDSVERTQDAVNNAVKGTTDDRFWIGLMAAILCGAKFATHLGHIQGVNLDHLAGFLVEQLQEQRGERKVSANNLVNPEVVERLLADFIGANRDRMLLTKHIWRAQGHPPTGWVCAPINNYDVHNKTVVIRGATVDGFLRLSTSALTGWLKKERDGLGRAQIIGAIKDTIPSARFIKAQLGHGTELKTPRQDVIELDLSQMPGFFDFS